MNQNWIYDKRSTDSLTNFLNVLEKSKTENRLKEKHIWHSIFPTKSLKRKKEILDSESAESLVIGTGSENYTVSEFSNDYEPLSKKLCSNKPQDDELNINAFSASNNPEYSIVQFLKNFQMENKNDTNLNKTLSTINPINIVDSVKPEQFLNICLFFCNQSDGAIRNFMNNFCQSFLYPYLKKGIPSRYTDKAFLVCLSKFPTEICKYVILPLMFSYNPLPSLFHLAISNLNQIQKVSLLKDFLESHKNSIISIWIFPIIISLLKSIPEKNTTLNSYIINFLKLNSKKFANSSDFGKLLYACIQTFQSVSLDSDGKVVLKIISEHQTPFRDACLKALNAKKSHL